MVVYLIEKINDPDVIADLIIMDRKNQPDFIYHMCRAWIGANPKEKQFMILFFSKFSKIFNLPLKARLIYENNPLARDLIDG